MKGTGKSFWALAGAALALAGCTDSLAGPPEPSQQIMIDLPTIQLVAQGSERLLAVSVSVTRGLVEAAASERFFLNTSVRLMDEDLADDVIVIAECPVADVVKEDQLRKGALVPVTAYLPLSAAAWEALVAADGGDGDLIDVSFVIELELRDAAGGRKLLNSVSALAQLDFK
jgi:hypothetical protein